MFGRRQIKNIIGVKTRKRSLKLFFFGGFRKPRIFLQVFLCFILIFVTTKLITIDYSIAAKKTTSETRYRNISAKKENLEYCCRSTNLRRYFQTMTPLIEPLSILWSDDEEVPLLVLVASSPTRKDYRTVIRKTWGKHLRTYFVLGLNANTSQKEMTELEQEAKLFKDMVVFNFIDHYYNQTIKTALMLGWTVARCPRARFLYKVDDDMFVNPWMLTRVMKRHINAQIIGFVVKNKKVVILKNDRIFLPDWLFPLDIIPQFIIGSGYLINGNKVKQLFRTALHVHFIHLEDVYFTHMVGERTLGFKLTHRKIMWPYGFQVVPPWFPLFQFDEIYSCIYWSFASLRYINREEVLRIWPRIEEKGAKYIQGEDVCSFYTKYLKKFVLLEDGKN